MHQHDYVEASKLTLKNDVKNFTNEAVEMCYQCGKCSAGCPVADEMDISPNQVLRMLQVGYPELDDKLLSSLSIWLCLTCEMCVSRCPKEVDLPLIMDYLRSESIKRDKVNPLAKDLIKFHRTFLDSVRNNGRLYEVGLIAGYKIRTMHLFQDLDVAPTMFFNGLLNIFPHRIQNRKAIARIFKRAEEFEENEL